MPIELAARTHAGSRLVAIAEELSAELAVHGFDNHGTEDASFLAICSPGLMTPDYFREIDEVLPSTPDTPPDMATVAEVLRRHGMTPALPVG